MFSRPLLGGGGPSGLLGAPCPADGCVGVKLGLPVPRMLTTPRLFLPTWVGSSVSSQAWPSLRFSRDLRVSCCLAVPHPQPLLGMLGRVLAALFAFPALFSREESGGSLASGATSWGRETSPRSSGPSCPLGYPWGTATPHCAGRAGPVSGLRSAPGQTWEAGCGSSRPSCVPGLASSRPSPSPGPCPWLRRPPTPSSSAPPGVEGLCHQGLKKAEPCVDKARLVEASR